jgi:hypothetical protein
MAVTYQPPPFEVDPRGILYIFLFYQSFLEAPADFLKHFWIQVAVLLLKPPHGGFRSETAVARYETVSEVKRLQIYNGYM